MRIGELAKRSGCSVQTIRYYEKEGLLSSASRSAGNFRLYDQNGLDRLTFIKRCRNLDLSLKEVKQLLKLSHTPKSTCDKVNQMVEQHIEHVEERITELENLRSQLLRLRGNCSENRTVDQCGIIKNLVQN